VEITFIIIFTCGLEILFDGKVCILHSVFASLHGETLIMETPTRRLFYFCGMEILFDGKVCILHSVFASLHGETLIMETPTRRLFYFQTPKIKKFVLHEKRKGNQACPQCKNKYKRLKGKSSTNIYFHLFVILPNNAT